MKMLNIFLLLLFFITPANAGTKKEVECLAKNIYHEARGEGKLGMYAVADVTLNRLKSKRFPDSICGVVYQRLQFSWTSKEPSISEIDSYKLAESIAWAILNGKNRGITDGSMWYHEASINPKWSKKKLVSVVINNHIFYTKKDNT